VRLIPQSKLTAPGYKMTQPSNSPILSLMCFSFQFRTFQESEAKNMELRRDLYDKMVSLDASEPTSEEHDQQAITKLRYMQVVI